MRLHLHTLVRHLARSLVALLCALLSLVTVSSTHAQQNWRWANSLPASVQWKDVAFGNGVYVAVGADTTVATSPDGATWTVRRMGTGQSVFNGIEFGNGQFVAVGMGSPTRTGAALIMTSTDGANWSMVESVANSVNAQLRDIAYGGGTWVAVGFGGAKVLSSTDARTWTIRGTPGIAIPAKITYGAGRFVASGSGNTALTSTDGITWTNPTVATATNTLLEGAAYGSGKFVLVGRDSSFNAAAFTSTDGTTWTPANPIAGTTNSTGFIAVGASPTGFVAAGGNLVYSSVDGVTWTARTSALPTAPRQLGPITEGVSGATFAGTQFFVVGNYGSITTSTDGTTWARRSTGTVADLGAVLHDGTRFVASGSGGTVLTSTDGSAWTQLATGSTADFHELAYNGTRYVTAGFNGIYHSTNLTTWTAVPGTTSDRWTAAAYGGGRFVVANSATTLGIRTSTDGATWSAAIGIPGAGGNTNRLVYGGNIFVLTATGFGSTPGKIYTSTDGTGWTQRAATLLSTSTQIFSIDYGAGRFVALTGDQRSLTSTDGITWTSTALSPLPSLNGVRFIGGQFYATANSYGSPAYASTDGITWTLVGDSAGSGFVDNGSSGGAKFAAANGAVVFVGSSGMILRGELPVTSAAGRLINLSVLTDIASPGDSFTLGYVVGGTNTTGSKPLVIRAAGPSLGALGVGGTLDDPKLETFAGSTSTGVNDNWGGSAQLTAALSAVGAFPYTGPTSRDSAVSANITTRDNSVAVSAAGNGTGTGTVIAEIYDATPAANFTATTPRLLNVSVRKHLGTGLTAGFVLGGGSPTKVLIRAVGPGLAAFGVEGTVVDPQLTLFNSSSTRVDSNDNWGGSAALTAAFASVGAFALPGATSRDAALLVTLPPGGYSVQVTGVGNTTGTALVEVYEVP